MPRTSKAGARSREAGYTYLAILVVLVAMALAAQTTFIPPESQRIRNAEEELMFRGLAYRRAIESYWRADSDAPVLPRTLQDLADDRRVDAPRHIRRLYAEPMAGEWVTIHGADGGITGVASGSTDAPRKDAFFPEGLEHFEGSASYQNWTFIFDPG